MIKEDAVLEINSRPRAEFDVFFQDEVQFNIDVSLFYIKSGEEEIQQYVDEIVKPEFVKYIADEKSTITALVDDGLSSLEEKTTNAQNTLDAYWQEDIKGEMDSYLGNTIKPGMDAYANDTVKPALQDFADGLTATFDENAAAKTAVITGAVTTVGNLSDNATAKAAAAASSAQEAADSASEASGSAETAESWAAGSIDERPEGSAKYWAQTISPETRVKIGSIIAYGGTSAPDGYLVCNGSAVSRTTYSELFEVIGTGFGSGDSSTTFNLPNLTSKTLWGSTSGIGGSLSSGLPDITGTLKIQYVHTVSTATGAFGKISGTGIAPYGNAGAVSNNAFDFDATRSSSVYGKSSIVQPPALKVLFCIKY